MTRRPNIPGIEKIETNAVLVHRNQPPKPPEHRFIQRTGTKPLIKDARKLTACILNFSLRNNYSVTRYRKLQRIVCSWKDQDSCLHHVDFRFEEMVDDISEQRSLDVTKFNLPLFDSFLDDGAFLSNGDGPVFTPDRKGFEHLALPLTRFLGPNFPIKPSIDREGIVCSSLQRPIQSNIVRLHAKLIDECNLAFESGDFQWLHNLRMLLNECYTIVDMTLHQLYFKARYKPKRGWKFDPKRLGQRQGRRIRDKLEWIFQITGKQLDDAQEELKDFRVLKDIRNHLNHLDPPAIAFTIEDVVNWLNRIQSIGKLLWKMRDKMDEPPSKGIVEIITLPVVEFVPKNLHLQRIPQSNQAGYASVIWPAKEPIFTG
ncbi:MAG: hypothetical protein HY912_08750 [Desulfomonile tiedjei]|uniref:Uncharacterized protein n=1 Tax=Desulfomonile tiedjei TaxID=2358 RepID=A0A9D6Z383_9BACT|nr:hypothetical protein [Desulfomonile tiedjei]